MKKFSIIKEGYDEALRASSNIRRDKETGRPLDIPFLLSGILENIKYDSIDIFWQSVDTYGNEDEIDEIKERFEIFENITYMELKNALLPYLNIDDMDDSFLDTLWIEHVIKDMTHKTVKRINK